MVLEELEKVRQIIDKQSTIIIDGKDGKEIDRNNIAHFVVVYDTMPETVDLTEWRKPKRKTRKKKSIEDIEIEESKLDEDDKDIKPNESSVDVSREHMCSVIAKKFRILDYDSAFVTSENWWICPIYKGQTELKPVITQEIKDGYVLIVVDQVITKIPEDMFSDDNKQVWEYSSLEVLSLYFSSDMSQRIYPKAVYRHKKDRYGSSELKALSNQVTIFSKTRIKVSNCITNIIYNKLGKRLYMEEKEKIAKELESKGKESDLKASIKKIDPKNIKIVEIVTNEYNSLIAYAKYNNIEIKNKKVFDKQILPKAKYITTYSMFVMIQSYLRLLQLEIDVTEEMKELVREHPLWQHYLITIKGCGEVNAGHILANFDAWNTEHPSSFIRYVGLDQIAINPENDLYSIDSKVRAIRLLFRDIELSEERSDNYNTPITDDTFMMFRTDSINSFEEYIVVNDIYKRYHNVFGYDIDTKSSKVLTTLDNLEEDSDFGPIFSRVLETYETIDIDDEENGGHRTLIKKRARTMKDKVLTTYLAKDGTIKTKLYLGYNAQLKGRLLGILFTGFLKAKGSYYSNMYYEKKAQLENRADIKEKIAKGMNPHVHMMARRYTMQKFIESLWIAARQYDGLPLNGGTYAEGKLGLFHKQGFGPHLIEEGYKLKTKVPKSKVY